MDLDKIKDTDHSPAPNDGASGQEELDDNSQQQQEPNPFIERLSGLEQTINTLAQTVQSQSQQFSQFQETLKPKKKQKTADELSELYEENPIAAMNEMLESKLDNKLSSYQQSMTSEAQRLQWDQKAKTDFPVDDAEFSQELNKVWNEMANDGYNVQHPKALYRAAKETAARLGKTQKREQSKDRQRFTDAEPPGAGGGTPPSGSQGGKRISDDDPRINFYFMRPGIQRTPEAVKKYKAYLSERDATTAKFKRRRR